jgi:hypothetical protein
MTSTATFLYFSEEFPDKLDQDEIIEILDNAKASNPEWHEAIIVANIGIWNVSWTICFFLQEFGDLGEDMEYKFSGLATLLVDKKKRFFVTNIVGHSS